MADSGNTLWVSISDKDIVHDRENRDQLREYVTTARSGKDYKQYDVRFAQGTKIGDIDLSKGSMFIFASSLRESKTESKSKGSDSPVWRYPLDTDRKYTISVPKSVGSSTEWVKHSFTAEEVKRALLDSAALGRSRRDQELVWIHMDKSQIQDAPEVTSQKTGKSYPMKQIDLGDGTTFRTFATNVKNDRNDAGMAWITLPKDREVYVFRDGQDSAEHMKAEDVKGLAEKDQKAQDQDPMQAQKTAEYRDSIELEDEDIEF